MKYVYNYQRHCVCFISGYDGISQKEYVYATCYHRRSITIPLSSMPELEISLGYPSRVTCPIMAGTQTHTHLVFIPGQTSAPNLYSAPCIQRNNRMFPCLEQTRYIHAYVEYWPATPPCFIKGYHATSYPKLMK